MRQRHHGSWPEPHVTTPIVVIPIHGPALACAWGLHRETEDAMLDPITLLALRNKILTMEADRHGLRHRGTVPRLPQLPATTTNPQALARPVAPTRRPRPDRRRRGRSTLLPATRPRHRPSTSVRHPRPATTAIPRSRSTRQWSGCLPPGGARTPSTTRRPTTANQTRRRDAERRDALVTPTTVPAGTDSVATAPTAATPPSWATSRRTAPLQTPTHTAHRGCPQWMSGCQTIESSRCTPTIPTPTWNPAMRAS